MWLAKYIKNSKIAYTKYKQELDKYKKLPISCITAALACNC